MAFFVLDEPRNYCVYMHTFPNGKVYIGITGSNPLKRWGNGSNYNQARLRNAIKKFGWNNIKHEVLFESLTKEEAKQKEIELIAFYKSDNHEFGYNIKAGGDSSFNHTEETKRKMSATRKGRPTSEEAKRKIGLANKGRKRTEEQRKKISLAHMGIKQTEESKRKISLGQSGIKHHGCRKVAMIDKDTDEVIKVFDYIRQAQNETGINEKGISIVCRGLGKTFHGYKWKYYEEVVNSVLCD